MKKLLAWFKTKPTALENRMLRIIRTIALLSISYVAVFMIYSLNVTYSHMNISCAEGFEKEEYLAEIQQLPEEVQKSFILNNGSISIEKEPFERRLEKTGENCAGMYYHKYDRIWLLYPSSTIHEFGHYIYYHISDNYRKRIEECYNKEGTQCFDSRQLADQTVHVLLNGEILEAYVKDNIALGYMKKIDAYPTGEQYVDFTQHKLGLVEKDYPDLGQYATTSHEEYFSDYFRYWLKNRNDTDEIQKLKDKTPDTYDLFIDLENDNWGMNVDIMSKIFEKLMVIRYE